MPILEVDAKVVKKETNVTVSGSNPKDIHLTSSSRTEYYVTFQVPNNELLKFLIKGTEYGLLAENDIGNLTFQGTRFFRFKRIHSKI